MFKNISTLISSGRLEKEGDDVREEEREEETYHGDGQDDQGQPRVASGGNNFHKMIPTWLCALHLRYIPGKYVILKKMVILVE